MANDDCIRSDVDETHHDTTTTTTQTAIPIAAISPNPDPIQCRSQDIMGSDGDDDDDNENENDNDNENENHAKQPPQPRTLRRRRSVCRRCHRPAPSTCICEALPSQPVTLRQCAHIFVLQHPHETRRKNCSLPLIQLCLAPPHADQVVKLRYDEDDNASTPTEEKEYQNNSNNKNNTCLTVVQGRMLSPSHPDVQRCFWPKVDHTNTNNNRNVVWLLSPGGNAISLTRALDEWRLITSQSDSTPPPMLTLLFLDATWRYAREMDRSNVQHQLYPPNLRRVALTETDDLHALPTRRRFAIRTPPSPAHLSTAECLALVVARVEEDPTLYDTFMKPLDCMVQKWRHCHKANGNKTKHRQRKKKPTTS